MSVIASNKVSIGLRLAQRLPSSGSVSTVVNVESVRAKGSSDALAVVDKAATAVSEGAGLPGVVGGWAADDDLSALCDDGLAGLDQVKGVGVHGRSRAVVSRLAGLGALAGAYRAAVVGGSQGSTVVVAELNDDDVVGLNGVDNIGEAALDSVGARATATNSLVDDSCGQ